MGMPGPGWAAAAGEVEAFDERAAVGGLERAHELAVRRQAVDRAVEHAVAVVDVLGRQGPLEDDAVFEVGHAGGAFELVEDGLTVGAEELAVAGPVLPGAEVGRVDQDVERLAAGRGHLARLLGAGGGGEVGGGVGRGDAFLVDRLELLMRVAAEDEVVVGEVFVGPVEAEVEHDAGAGGFVGAFGVEAFADLAADELAVGADRVHVGHDGVAVEGLARLGLDAGDAAAIGVDGG